MDSKQYTLTVEGAGESTDGEGVTTAVGDWVLTIDEALDHIQIMQKGDQVGLVSGTIIDPQEQINDRTLELPGEKSTPAAFEDVLYQLAGRYIGLLITNDDQRLYLDPGGFLPAVYRTDGPREIASSQAMLDIDYDARFRDDLYERCHGGGRIWLPGRLTYHGGVRRLLPNHYLNLETWESVRHWPQDGDLPSEHDADQAANTILSNTNTIIDQVVDRYDDVYSSLTAGRDSRLLLTASRESSQAGEITYFTFGPRQRLDEDTYAAEILANGTGLEWVIINQTQATDTEQSDWLRTTGHAVNGAIMEIHPTLAGIPGDVRLVGLGGEVGRGMYWNDEDDLNTDLSAETLLDQMTRPAEPELVDEMRDWLDEVAEFDTYTTLDLAYQEFMLGCWGGPQQLGSAPLIDLIGPLCYRPSIKAMHAIPPEMRRDDAAVPYIIGREWPELASFPFNTFNDYRKYEVLARTALNNPRSAINRILSVFS